MGVISDRGEGLRGKLLVFLLAIQLLVPCPGLCQCALSPSPTSDAAVAQQHVDLNLTSTERSIPASAAIPAGSFAPARMEITSGGATRTISPVDLLTPAEFIALSQVISSGGQSLLLNAGGSASGGNFSLSSSLTQQLHTLVIPTNVTVARDFGTASSLSLCGNLTNSGSFYAYSSNQSVTSVVIRATNIVNNQGALLTTLLPTTGLPGIISPVAHLDLILDAVANIINSGTLGSSGSLLATAGGSIVNSLPAGATGGTPLMQALSNANLVANDIVNNGIIASATGNINLASVMSSALLVTNLAGQLQALHGAINVRSADYRGNTFISIAGGDMLSQELNVFADYGDVAVDLYRVTGTMNITGNAIKVNVQSGDARIGDVTAYGDPLYTAAGTYTVAGDVITNGGPLSIVAGQNIDDDGFAHQFDTSASDAAGGSILLAAGTNWSVSGSTLTFDGPTLSGAGGYISLPNISKFDSRGGTASLLDFSGGNVTLVAYGGGGANAGTITLPASLTNRSGGSNAGLGGTVTAIAGADAQAGTNSISIGSVNTVGSGKGAGGNIYLATAIPTGAVSVDTVEGAIISNTLAASTSFTNASIQTGALTTSNGGNIVILSGNNISTGADSVLSTKGFSGTEGFMVLAAGIFANNSSGSITVASSPGTVGTYETWQTLGVTTRATEFSIGQDLIQQFTNGGNPDPPKAANEVIYSGAATPTEEAVPAGTTVYKFVRSGTTPSAYTAYWTSEQAKDELLAEPEQIWNGQALPPSSYATGYDLYQITAVSPATIFKSATAPAVVTDTGLLEDGGFEQTIVPNRSLWGASQFVLSVPVPAPFVRSNSLFSRGNITLVASGNISVGGVAPSQSAVFGGNVFVCAGCQPVVGAGTVSVSSTNASSTGGQVAIFNEVATSGTLASWGGGVSLVALYGTGVPTPSSGTIAFDSASPIRTFATNPASGLGISGSIVVLAGAAGLGGANAISLGSIDANGGKPATPSNIYLGTSTPTGGASIDLAGGALANSFAANMSFIQQSSISVSDIASSGGNITVTAGGNINLSGNYVSASQTLGNGAGGAVSLTAQSGYISAPDILSLGYSGNGGSIALTAGTTILADSIDASSGGGGGNGGNVSLKTQSASTFVIGGATGNNGLLGTIHADGMVNGGTIAIVSSGSVTVNLDVTANGGVDGGTITMLSFPGVFSIAASSSILANGGTGLGGQIGLQLGMPCSTLLVGNNGFFRATSAANNTGRIGFNGGNGGRIIIFGNGDLLAGDFVGVGNLDSASLVPLATLFGAQFVVEQLSILNRLLLSPILPPASVVQSFWPLVPVGLLLAGLNSTMPSSTVVATDRTPVSEWSSQKGNAVVEARADWQALQGQVSIEVPGAIACATFDSSSFDSAALSSFGSRGIVGVSNSSQSFKMDKGNIFFAPDKDVVIDTHECTIFIAAGSQTLVMETGSDVAVLNFHDDHKGGVRIVVNKREVSLQPGQEICFTRTQQADFDKVNPASKIAYRGVSTYDMGDNIKAFMADFSIVGAFHCLTALQDVLKSSEPHLRQSTSKLLKTVAALSVVTTSKGPFHAGRP